MAMVVQGVPQLRRALLPSCARYAFSSECRSCSSSSSRWSLKRSSCTRAVAAISRCACASQLGRGCACALLLLLPRVDAWLHAPLCPRQLKGTLHRACTAAWPPRAGGGRHAGLGLGHRLAAAAGRGRPRSSSGVQRVPHRQAGDEAPGLGWGLWDEVSQQGKLILVNGILLQVPAGGGAWCRRLGAAALLAVQPTHGSARMLVVAAGGPALAGSVAAWQQAPAVPASGRAGRARTHWRTACTACSLADSFILSR